MIKPHLYVMPEDSSGGCGECGRSCIDPIHVCVGYVQSGRMPHQDGLEDALNRRQVEGWNEALEAAAQLAENFGNAPPNPDGRRARLAAAIRKLSLVID
jgi:hypothetical protein